MDTESSSSSNSSNTASSSSGEDDDDDEAGQAGPKKFSHSCHDDLATQTAANLQ